MKTSQVEIFGDSIHTYKSGISNRDQLLMRSIFISVRKLFNAFTKLT